MVKNTLVRLFFIFAQSCFVSTKKSFDRFLIWLNNFWSKNDERTQKHEVCAVGLIRPDSLRCENMWITRPWSLRLLGELQLLHEKKYPHIEKNLAITDFCLCIWFDNITFCAENNSLDFRGMNVALLDRGMFWRVSIKTQVVKHTNANTVKLKLRKLLMSFVDSV